MSLFARYLFDGHLNADRTKVKATAFKPPKGADLSVLLEKANYKSIVLSKPDSFQGRVNRWIDIAFLRLRPTLSEDLIWTIGRCVESVRNRARGSPESLRARGRIASQLIDSLGLKMIIIRADCFPARRHWDISRLDEKEEGLSDSDRAERKRRAERLAEAATLDLIPYVKKTGTK